mmetsp:Transcript_28408/g.69246  ORF Transcript_28408/g.69246 Transcript_28408/m.69246 type:complete len:166 (+) Transcript_28408:41-538(+)
MSDKKIEELVVEDAGESKKEETGDVSFVADPAKVMRKVKILDRSKEFEKKNAEKGEATEKKGEDDALKAIRSAFEKWSIDKKYIGRSEVVQVLRKSGMMPSEKDLDSIISGIDTDNNGRINWEDWLKAYTRKTQRANKSNEPNEVSQMEESLRRKRGQPLAVSAE